LLVISCLKLNEELRLT